MADLFGEHIRGGDFAARYGGEEFDVVLPDTSDGHSVRLTALLNHFPGNLDLTIPATPR